jgi:hypothetical protein
MGEPLTPVDAVSGARCIAAAAQTAKSSAFAGMRRPVSKTL